MELNINCALIRKVLSRLVSNREFIQITQHLLKLTSLDVCICLELNASDEDVNF